MHGHVRQRVCLVGVAELLESDSRINQGLDERHRVLIVHVVVARTMNQQKFFAIQILSQFHKAAFLVVLQVVVLRW